MRINRYTISRLSTLVVAVSFLSLQAASAQVVYTDVAPDATISDAGFEIDFNNDGVNEFQIHQGFIANCHKVRILGHGDTSIDHLLATAMHDAKYTMRFAQNATIDSSDPFVDSDSFVMEEGTSEWNGYAEGYVGVMVSLDGQMHYGWVRISVAADGSTVTIMDFAYEATPGVPIDAGMGSLPVELAQFDARIDELDVLLSWSTLSETSNAGFEVQQRVNGTFENVTFVPGLGTTSIPQDYSYRVTGAGVGALAFRLKQMDLDGNYSYSPIVNVSVDLPSTHFLGDAYPNPFNPEAQFALTVNKTQRVSVGIYNTVGQQVAEIFSGMLDANETKTFTIDGSSLSSGIYLYRVSGQNFDQTRTITLLK